MARRSQPFCIRRRKDTGYLFYKLAGWKTYKPTGTKLISEAQELVKRAMAEERRNRGPDIPLRAYLEPFYQWDRCPHVRRLQQDGRRITRRHVDGTRRLIDGKILKDPIADLPVREIRRADVLDFRSRLLEAGTGPRVVNRTMAALKVAFREGVFREELERDPTQKICYVA